MSLATAFEFTRSALAQNGERSSLISRNVAGASDPDYSRKTVQIVTDDYGRAIVGAPARTVDRLLFATSLDSSASAAAAAAKRAALDQLDPSAADPNATTSLASLTTGLQNALQTASATPSSTVALQSAVSSARALADGLRNASARVDTQRNQADLGIVSAVKDLDALLVKFTAADRAVRAAVVAGTDRSDLEDARDGIVKQIAEKIGVRMNVQPDGAATLQTDGGVTLYENGARPVSFAGTGNLGPGVAGAAVFIDGVPVTGTGPMASRSGSIAGLAAVRDTEAPIFQAQLDNIARGLIEAFAEKDPSGSKPDATGLFVWSGSPGLPGQPTPSGLAGSIAVPAVVDAARNGDPRLLRDGGIAGVAYALNATSSSGFTARLDALTSALAAPRTFDAATQAAAGNQGVTDFTSASSAWLAAARKSATDTASYQGTLATQARTALSNATGVNIDDEMARMLEVEHAYQTSARLISTIDQMYAALLQSGGG